jgi:hypothetical protein
MSAAELPLSFTVTTVTEGATSATGAACSVFLLPQDTAASVAAAKRIVLTVFFIFIVSYFLIIR